MENISLIDLAKIIWKKIWIVGISSLVCIAIALCYCLFFAKSAYAASSTVLFASGVLFKDEEDSQLGNTNYITTGELSTTFAMMKSFSGILMKSTDYYVEALRLAEAKGLNGTYSVDSLMAVTKVTFEEDSVFITITVTVDDKEDAVVLISALSEAAPTVVTSKIGRTSADVLNVDDKAFEVTANTPLFVLLALVVGVAVSSAIIVISNRLDKTIKGEEDLLSQHDLPLLGVVPLFDVVKKKGRFGE